ncbi:MAG: hypothetical protein P4L85_11920 [Paludisphaera borealis]|uniref:hypothetical protein n=1 Tax=Paludisphaera borealis TaxID=1387353 RepID=UPI0028408BBF|nr:hypothetical protein [Paludisphaera borealis]MDR3620049.1 hypothetical protein [Paludisphaera borealis]
MRMQQTHRASYDCPHCREPLEARAGPWRGWLLCPRCGRPGMPPEPSKDRVSRWSRKTIGHGWLDGESNPRPAPVQGVFVTRPVANGSSRSSIAHVAAAIGLLVVGPLAWIVYQNQFSAGTVMHGLLALALCCLLAMVGRRR